MNADWASALLKCLAEAEELRVCVRVRVCVCLCVCVYTHAANSTQREKKNQSHKKNTDRGARFCFLALNDVLSWGCLRVNKSIDSIQSARSP